MGNKPVDYYITKKKLKWIGSIGLQNVDFYFYSFPKRDSDSQTIMP